jgi:hypothetical protein
MWHEHSCTTRELPLDFVIPTITSVPSCSEPSRPSLTVARQTRPAVDRSYARGNSRRVGRGKETGFQVEQRN